MRPRLDLWIEGQLGIGGQNRKKEKKEPQSTHVAEGTDSELLMTHTRQCLQLQTIQFNWKTSIAICHLSQYKINAYKHAHSCE